MRTELVIFDHDGVLVDSEIIAMDILAGISSNFGFSLTRDEAFHRYLGTSFDYVVEDLLTGERWTWHGARNYVELDPAVRVAHIFRVVRGGL